MFHIQLCNCTLIPNNDVSALITSEQVADPISLRRAATEAPDWLSARVQTNTLLDDGQSEVTCAIQVPLVTSPFASKKEGMY